MDLEPVIRVGRDGRRWIAVCLIETPWGPVVVTAVGDERAVYQGVLARLREQHGAHVGFLGGLGKIAKKAARSITRSSVVKNVAKQMSKIAKNPIVATAIKLHTSPLKLAAGALKGVTNNPLWNMAATGASFIPGVGTAVSAGMSAAAALGKGQSLKDVGLAAIKGAIPGGPVGKAAFDVAMGIASGQRIDKIALNAVRNQLPGGPLAKAAFDTGLKAIQTRSLKGVPAMMAKAAVDHAGKGPLWDKLKTGAQIIPGLGATTSAGMAGAIALGRRSGVQNFALSAARSALPGGSAMRTAFDAGLGIAQGKGLSAVALKAVRDQLPRGPAVQAAFNTALTIARARPGDTGALQALHSSMPAGPLRQQLTSVAARAMRQRQTARDADIPDIPTEGVPIYDAPIPSPPEPFSADDFQMEGPMDEGVPDDAAMSVGAMEAATEIGRRLRYGDRRARARVRAVWRRAKGGDPVARAAAKAIRRAMAKKGPMPIASKGAVEAAQAAPQDEPMDDIPEPPEPDSPEGGEPPPPPPPEASAGFDGTDALIESMGYDPGAYSAGAHRCASCGHPSL